MPAKTQDIRQILNISDNLYEAVLAIARRARQINEEMYQKKRDRQILEELEGGYEDEFLMSDADDRDVKEAAEDEDNPITVAEGEYLSESLEYHYDSSRR